MEATTYKNMVDERKNMKRFKLNLQYFAESGLVFLKDVLGDQYSAFETAINTYNTKPENRDKQIKIGNLSTGEYVSKAKYDAVEVEKDNYKGQLTTAQETLKSFDGVDVDKLKGEINTLQTTLKTKETEFQNQLAERDFNQQLEAAIGSVGARNAKAVKALLDIDALKASKNQEADIKAAIEACQKDNDYLFGSDEPIKSPVGPTGAPLPGPTKKLEEMSYDEYKAYRQGK